MLDVGPEGTTHREHWMAETVVLVLGCCKIVRVSATLMHFRHLVDQHEHELLTEQGTYKIS